MGRLRLVAFVAALALVSGALLPLAHSATAHAGDCGVCSAIAHGGASVAGSAPPPAPALPVAAACGPLDARAPESAFPWRGFDVRSARAPPLVSVTA
jgi:hypothetical protein